MTAYRTETPPEPSLPRTPLLHEGKEFGFGAVCHLALGYFTSRLQMRLEPAITGNCEFTQHIFLIREFPIKFASIVRSLKVYLK